MSYYLGREALDRYKENGIRSVLRALYYYPDFHRVPVLERFIGHVYTDIVVPSHELKSRYSSRFWELDEDLNGLHPDLNEEIAPFQNDSSLGHVYWPRFSFKQPFVAEVPNTTVVGPSAIAVTSDGRCLLDPTDSLVHTPGRRLGGGIKESIADSPTTVLYSLLRGTAPEADRSTATAAILCSYWENYYHWTLEELPKLRGIQRYQEATGKPVTLIIRSDPPRYVTQSLEILGYTEDDWLEWSGGELSVDNLIVPSYPDLTPLTLEWLRSTMTERIEKVEHTESPDWIYISRQNSEARRVDNYEEVKRVLDRYGIKVVECEELSMVEEVSLFSGVEGIIGPHGAGLTSAVWGSDIHLVEIFNDVIQAPYYLLAHVLDYEYTAMSGDPVGEIRERRNQNIRVDVQTLEAILEDAVDSGSS